MHLLFTLLVSWATVLGAIADDPAEDQFGEEVEWSAFTHKPFVLVIADKEASDNAKEIGIALHKSFNGSYTAPEAHLRNSPANEKVKIIPVAALPDVPGIFKFLFRNGFKDEAPIGVILDWDSKLSKSVGYEEGQVLVAIKTPKNPEVVRWQVKNKEEALRVVRESL